MTNHGNKRKTAAALLFALCCLLAMPLVSRAQFPDPNNPDQEVIPGQFDSNDSLNVDDIDAVGIDPVGADVLGIDSLVEQKVSFENVDVPVFEDSVYRSRLLAINSLVPLDYNDEVRKYIDLYVLHRRDQIEHMLGLSKFYFPIFDQVLEQYGVPPELKYVSIIESALNPQAVSRAGAVGMWQFMYGTAKQYGLSINNYVDDRRDIIRSTEGAAQNLKNMYAIYGDWLLAIASYNCGPGNVNRAIKRSGGHTFWEVRAYLPKETRGYVPAFIAATYVMNYYELHNLETQFPKYSWDSIVTIEIKDKMACEAIGQFCNLSADEVRFLNPGLRSNVIPALDQPYYFKMPCDRAELFCQNKDSIIYYSLNVKQQFYFGSMGDCKVYVVRRGDNLGSIASRYHVSVSQIKRWNHLSSSVIRAGQHLRITTPGGETGVASAHKLSASKSTVTKTASAQTSSNPKVSPLDNSDTTRFVYYKARNGDTLWEIARRHGTTMDSIRTLNGASKCNNLKVGTVLKISLKG
jgi:membrane-bound lytic murein transglycosylase D